MILPSSFFSKKVVIGVIHLDPLPGSPSYNGSIKAVLEKALHQTKIYENYVDAIIVENFGDAPFFKSQVPIETVTSMTRIVSELKHHSSLPIGINVLRNDGISAISIASATESSFIRVNVLSGAALTDQGIIEGEAHLIHRKRKQLNSNVSIFADIRVKHAAPLVSRSLEEEVSELSHRAGADALIVSGIGTGHATDPELMKKIKNLSSVPVLLGSGVTASNLSEYSLADGFIVGSFFKEEGKVHNDLDENRLIQFRKVLDSLSQ